MDTASIKSASSDTERDKSSSSSMDWLYSAAGLAAPRFSHPRIGFHCVARMLNPMLPPRALHCDFRLSDAILPLLRPLPELLNLLHFVLLKPRYRINVRAWLSTNSGQPFLILSLRDLPSRGYSLQLPADQTSLYPARGLQVE